MRTKSIWVWAVIGTSALKVPSVLTRSARQGTNQNISYIHFIIGHFDWLMETLKAEELCACTVWCVSSVLQCVCVCVCTTRGVYDLCSVCVLTMFMCISGSSLSCCLWGRWCPVCPEWTKPDTNTHNRTHNMICEHTHTVCHRATVLMGSLPSQTVRSFWLFPLAVSLRTAYLKPVPACCCDSLTD